MFKSFPSPLFSPEEDLYVRWEDIPIYRRETLLWVCEIRMPGISQAFWCSKFTGTRFGMLMFNGVIFDASKVVDKIVLAKAFVYHEQAWVTSSVPVLILPYAEKPAKKVNGAEKGGAA